MLFRHVMLTLALLLGIGAAFQILVDRPAFSAGYAIIGVICAVLALYNQEAK